MVVIFGKADPVEFEDNPLGAGGAASEVADIVEALKTLNDQAAEEFVQLYLGDMLKDKEL
jgi:hypothetical protein